MSECDEHSNSCTRCARSAPVASLIGLVLVLVGGGIFSGGTIFARRHLLSVLEQPHLLQYLDYIVYGLLGVLVLFAFIVYLICTLSSGRNVKHCFENNRKSSCGSCCNMTIIVSLTVGVLLWTAIACIMAYPLINVTVLIHRQEGPTRLLLEPLSITKLDESRRYTPFMKTRFFDGHDNDQRRRDRRTEFTSFMLPIQHSANSALGIDDETTLSWFSEGSQSQGTRSNFDENAAETISSFPLPEVPKQLDSESGHHQLSLNAPIQEVKNITGKLEDHVSKLQSLIPKKIGEEAESLLGAAVKFFRCGPNNVDLSYYGLYDEKRLPICLPGSRVDEFTKDTLICCSIAMAGIFMIILGHVQIAACVAINYARLQKHRYYHCSDVGKEGDAL